MLRPSKDRPSLHVFNPADDRLAAPTRERAVTLQHTARMVAARCKVAEGNARGRLGLSHVVPTPAHGRVVFGAERARVVKPRRDGDELSLGRSGHAVARVVAPT